MHEIFISYRRIDTEASGGHLYADLCRQFGADSVFMDTHPGGIPWGADWEKSLKDALDGCKVLIALIGPQWLTCERSPGLRRLDAPDDWVRGEIATVLKRRGTVLPVLFQGAPNPPEDQLPEELRSLRFHKLQADSISEHHWDDGVKNLVERLVDAPKLKQLHDFATSETGLRLLEYLVRHNQKVAEAVHRSRAVIETTERGVDELTLLKGVHDALHEIESECLILLRETPSAFSLDRGRLQFKHYSQDVIPPLLEKLAADVPELGVLWSIELPLYLKTAADAFKKAVDSRSQEDYDRVVGTLEELTSGIPTRLNDEIDKVISKREMEQLQQLMSTVANLLGPDAKENPELKQMFDSIGALENLRNELALRVKEHGLLQSLDKFLRSIVGGQRRAGTGGRIDSTTLAIGWRRICLLRKEFKEPFSPEMKRGHRRLKKLEPAIKAAVKLGDEPNAAARLGEYYNETGVLFREADKSLKDFCETLRKKTQPLKSILDMC